MYDENINISLDDHNNNETFDDKVIRQIYTFNNDIRINIIN